MDRKNFESGWDRFCKKLNESEGKKSDSLLNEFVPKADKPFKPFEPKAKEGDRWALKAQALKDKEKIGKGGDNKLSGWGEVGGKTAELIWSDPNWGGTIHSVYRLSPPCEDNGTEYEYIYTSTQGNGLYTIFAAIDEGDGEWANGKTLEMEDMNFSLNSAEEGLESMGYKIETGKDSAPDPVPERKIADDNDLGSRLNQDHRKRHPEIYKPFKDPNTGEDRYFPSSVHESWKKMLSEGLWNDLDEARNKDPNLRPKRIDRNNEEDMQQVMAARELMGQQDQNRTAGQQQRVERDKEQRKQNIIAQKKMNRSARPGRIDPNDEKQMQQVAAGRALSQKQDQNRAGGQQQSVQQQQAPQPVAKQNSLPPSPPPQAGSAQTSGVQQQKEDPIRSPARDSKGVDEEKKRILQKMSKTDPRTPEYKNLQKDYEIQQKAFHVLNYLEGNEREIEWVNTKAAEEKKNGKDDGYYTNVMKDIKKMQPQPKQQSQSDQLQNQVAQGQSQQSNLTPEQKKRFEDRRIAASQRRQSVQQQQVQNPVQQQSQPQQIKPAPIRNPQQRQAPVQQQPVQQQAQNQQVQAPRQRQSVRPPSAAEQMGISQEEFDRRKAERKAGQKNLRGAFNESVQEQSQEQDSIHQDWKSYLKRGLLNESADIINMGDFKKGKDRKEGELAVKEAELSFELAKLLFKFATNKFGEDSNECSEIQEWIDESGWQAKNAKSSYKRKFGDLDFLNSFEIRYEAEQKVPEYLKNLGWDDDPNDY